MTRAKQIEEYYKLFLNKLVTDNYLTSNEAPSRACVIETALELAEDAVLNLEEHLEILKEEENENNA